MQLLTLLCGSKPKVVNPIAAQRRRYGNTPEDDIDKHGLIPSSTVGARQNPHPGSCLWDMPWLDCAAKHASRIALADFHERFTRPRTLFVTGALHCALASFRRPDGKRTIGIAITSRSDFIYYGSFEFFADDYADISRSLG